MEIHDRLFHLAFSVSGSELSTLREVSRTCVSDADGFLGEPRLLSSNQALVFLSRR